MPSNKHGLSRHIPESIKREVRRRSKFGCVVCRCAVYQYEHINPVFVEATKHDPTRICLLCGRCHDKVTRGRLSKRTVDDYYRLVQESSEISRPGEELDLSDSDLFITIGSCEFLSPKCIFEVDGEQLLSITPPQDGAAFPSLSGLIYDREGNEAIRILKNEWQGLNDAWDIQVVGKRVKIQTVEGRIALDFTIHPPNGLTISQLDMRRGKAHICIYQGQLWAGYVVNQHGTYLALDFNSNTPEVAVRIDTRGVSEPPDFQGVQINENGAILLGTGISVGVNGIGATLMGDVKAWRILPK